MMIVIEIFVVNLELLQPNLKRNNERIVICACDANSANELFKTLPPCPWLLLATELMAPCEVLGEFDHLNCT